MNRLILILTFFAIGCSKTAPLATSVSHKEVLAQKALVGTAGMTFHELVDHTRVFIHDHSRHPADPSPYDPNDVEQWAEAMNAFIDGKGEKPILYCGQRARLHMVTLSEAGLNSRLVNLITNGETPAALQGHVFLEVLNPETGLWEVTDADFDLYYSNGEKRLSLRDLIAEPLTAYEPCRGTTCGWDLPASQDLFRVEYMLVNNYYSVGLVHPGIYNIPANDQLAHIISNPSRFDVLAPQPSLGGKSVLQYYSTDVGGTWEQVGSNE